MPHIPPDAARKTRIQAQNEQRILDGALEVFSVHGFRGTTVDQIAKRCGLSKPNLLYYFRRKADIYTALLERTLEVWLEPLRALDAEGDPITELSRYVSAKVRMSRQRPEASRLFANEILSGAPAITPFLRGPLKQLVDEKASVIARWSAEGRLAPVDPYHLIFAIWATTQHYADFEAQVAALLGSGSEVTAGAEAALLTIFVEGLKPRLRGPF